MAAKVKGGEVCEAPSLRRSSQVHFVFFQVDEWTSGETDPLNPSQSFHAFLAQAADEVAASAGAACHSGSIPTKPQNTSNHVLGSCSSTCFGGMAVVLDPCGQLIPQNAWFFWLAHVGSLRMLLKQTCFVWFGMR